MEKLVGEYLRELSPLTSTQIVDALRNQLIQKDCGNCRLLGELLVEAGHVSRDQLEEALKRQESETNPRIQVPFYPPPLNRPPAEMTGGA